MASAVSALDDIVRTAMIEYVCDPLQDYVDDDGMAAPWEAYIATAQV